MMNYLTSFILVQFLDRNIRDSQTYTRQIEDNPFILIQRVEKSSFR